ncbi:MAG: cupin domain-containing protein [archaeon]
MNKDWKDVRKLIEYPKEGILSKVLISVDGFNLTLFCMAKGSEMTEHTSTKRGTIHVLEGDGIFVLEGKKIKMKKDALIYMDKDAKHSLKAKKNTSFLLSLSK